MDFLTIAHLVFYPIVTGMLITASLVNLVKGNRWAALLVPATSAMFFLTLSTFEHYASYLAP